jgi:hypothetical protein
MSTGTATDTDGVVHGITPLQGEHTLCGNAFDCYTDDLPGWTEDKKERRVNCPDCIRVILACRDMKIARKKKGDL